MRRRHLCWGSYMSRPDPRRRQVDARTPGGTGKNFCHCPAEFSANNNLRRSAVRQTITKIKVRYKYVTRRYKCVPHRYKYVPLRHTAADCHLPGHSNPMATSSPAFALCSRLLYAFEFDSYKQGLSCHQSISFSSRSTFHSNCAIFSFVLQTVVRLLISQGPQNISGGRKYVADECVVAYTLRHDSSTTICPRQLVFNTKRLIFHDATRSG